MRTRRQKCFWEPTYNPELVGRMTDGSWELASSVGPVQCTLKAVSLRQAVKAGKIKPIFRGKTFKDCDFEGVFEVAGRLAFDHCRFEGCDFSQSTLKRVKFSGCAFVCVSFGQVVFEDCEFRDCTWDRLGLSPNGTELRLTYVSNPDDFIAAACTNLDRTVLDAFGADPITQRVRLESTKATIARAIFRNHLEVGNDDAFYRAVRVFQLQDARSRRTSEWHSRPSIIKKPFSWCKHVQGASVWGIQEHVLRLLGWTNAWGASVAKPLIIYAVCFLIFIVLYDIAPSTLDVSGLRRSFDIALLAGYTNYGMEGSRLVRTLQGIQLFVSVVLYSIVFATVIARTSRVR